VLIFAAVIALGVFWWWSSGRGPIRVARPPAVVPGGSSEVEPDPAEVPSGDDGEEDLEELDRLARVEVVDQDGKPVAQANVRIFGWDNEAQDSRFLEMKVTDAAGLARFGSVPTYGVEVRRVGYALAWVDLLGLGPNLRITLVPRQVLRGRAVAFGAPAEGATIQVWDTDASAGYDQPIDLPQTTGADGGFTVTGLREGHPFILVATYHGCATVVQEVPTTARDIVVTLGEGLTLTGSVVDDGGKPSAAEIAIAPAGQPSPFDPRNLPWYQLGSGQRQFASMVRPVCADGRFTVRGMAPGAYDVHARGSGGAAKSDVVINGDAHVAIQLVRQATLVVRITSEDGSYIGTQRVVLLRNGEWHHCQPGKPTTLAPGPYLLCADADYAAGVHKKIVLKPGEAREMKLELGKGLRIWGRVVDESGKPIKYAVVRTRQTVEGHYVWAKREQTDEEGYWGLGGLVPGKAELRFEGTGYYPLIETIDVVAGERPDARLTPAAKITGRFVPPPSDTGLEAFFIPAEIPGLYVNGRVNADGSFEFHDPGFEGPLRITLTPNGRPPVEFRGVELKRGQDRDLGEIALVDGVPLRLTLVDEAGKPIEAALVEVCAPWRVEGLRTDSRGQLESPNQPHALTLRIVVDGHATTYVRVDATKPVTVRPVRGVEVRGTVQDATGKPAGNADIHILKLLPNGYGSKIEEWVPKVDGSGEFSIRLPPGKYRVRHGTWHGPALPGIHEVRAGARMAVKLR